MGHRYDSRILDTNLFLSDVADSIEALSLESEVILGPHEFAEEILGLKGPMALFKKPKQVLSEFYNPEMHYRELVLAVGMRSGKTQLAGFIAVYEAYRYLCLTDPWMVYRTMPGTPVTIPCVSYTAKQTKKTAYHYIKAFIEGSDWFMRRRPTIRTGEIKFESHELSILVGSGEVASNVGTAILCFILDEFARFPRRGVNSAKEMYTGLLRGLMTLDGRGVTISSPIAIDDPMMDLLKTTEDIPSMLGYQVATWDWNDHLPFSKFKEHMERDPEGTMRDHGAQPSAALERFYQIPERIDTMWDHSRTPGISKDSYLMKDAPFYGNRNHLYAMTLDPSTKGDAFGLSLGHLEQRNGKPFYVVDTTHRFVPTKTKEIDPIEVSRVVLGIADACRVVVTVFDMYAYQEILRELANKNINCVMHRADIITHQMLKDVIYTQQISAAYDAVLNVELKELELIRGSKVDHPWNGSKDVADTTANLVWALSQEKLMKAIPVNSMKVL